MWRTPKLPLRRGVEVAKCAVVASIAFVAVASAGSADAEVGAEAQAVAEPSASTAAPAGQDRLDRLIDRHDCSVTGFGADVIPGSSLVLRDDRVRHVSFDDGWAVYTGEQSGSLLAVCLVTL